MPQHLRVAGAQSVAAPSPGVWAQGLAERLCSAHLSLGRRWRWAQSRMLRPEAGGGSRFWKELQSTRVALSGAFPCSSSVFPLSRGSGSLNSTGRGMGFLLPPGLCDLGLPTHLSELLFLREEGTWCLEPGQASHRAPGR